MADRGLTIPPPLAREYPGILDVPEQRCQRNCFKGLKQVQGCKGMYYPHTEGTPIYKANLASLKAAMKKPCFVASPDALTFSYGKVIPWLYYLREHHGLTAPALCVEASVWSATEMQAGQRGWVYEPMTAIPPPGFKFVGCDKHQKDICTPELMQARYPKGEDDASLPTRLQMARAVNVKEVWVGVETGCPDLRHKYGKSVYRNESWAQATAKLQGHFKVGWYLIASEYDTPESLNMTVALVRDCGPDRVFVSCLERSDDKHHAIAGTIAKHLTRLLRKDTQTEVLT